MAERKKYPPTRSFRMNDDVWRAAQKRADAEDKKMSEVLQLLVEGYARGMITLPRVQLVYTRGNDA